MSGFSPEVRHTQIEVQHHRCALLDLEVDVLEGHHCVPKCRGGSNNSHNCVELAGTRAYCVYGFPVEDVHERCDMKALCKGTYLNPDTLEFVPREQMPEDCFRSGKSVDRAEIRRNKKKGKKGNKHSKHKKF